MTIIAKHTKTVTFSRDHRGTTITKITKHKVNTVSLNKKELKEFLNFIKP